MEVKYFEEKNL